MRTWINYHPYTISKLWNASIAAALKSKSENIVNVHFEEMVTDPEKTIKNVCKFLNIGFQKEMMEISVIGSSSESDDENLKGIDRTKSGRWKNGGLNETEIWLCQKITRNYIQLFNYDEINCKPNIALLILYILIFPVKLSIAFVLNLHRFKNIKSLIKKGIK